MKVGSLVECVKPFIDQKHDPYTTYPILGEIYIVRDMEDDGIRLEEIINEKEFHLYKGREEYGECMFVIKNFSEVQPPMDLSKLLEETLLQTA